MSKGNDLLQPGSERLVAIKPSQILSAISGRVRPPYTQPYARGSGWVDPLALKVPEGTSYVDWLCDAFADRDRAALVRAEIERLEVLVAARRAAEEEEVRALRGEGARLEAVLKNAGARY